jgi:glyoxylate reductase
VACVFVSWPLPGDALARLKAAGHEVVVSEEGVAGAAFASLAERVEGIVSLLTDSIRRELLEKTPRLRVCANVAVGVDNIDLEACRARGVIVTNTPGVLTEATADLAFGLILAAARRIAEGDRLVRAGEWTGWTPTQLIGRPVHGATLGIVGMGRIGMAVARRARGFGMHVLYTQRQRLRPEMERALGATYTPIDTLFDDADVVSIHVPLTGETRHLVNAARLARMRPGSILVNTARGPVVDEAALARALREGPLAAAGLDVYEDEPRVPEELRALPNVVLAPHIGSADRPTREAMARTAADNAIAVLAGQPPLTPV